VLKKSSSLRCHWHFLTSALNTSLENVSHTACSTTHQDPYIHSDVVLIIHYAYYYNTTTYLYKMETTLTTIFANINANNVGVALACCDDDGISCTYPGKERRRVGMPAIFGQSAARGWQASFKIVSQDETTRTVTTKEFWGHANMEKINTTYTFTEDNKILSMAL
jgi:hypothetical protein